MLQLEKRHKAIVVMLLKEKLIEQRVFIFGLRSTNRSRKFSGLDICIEGDEITYAEMAKLKDAFSESDLPHFVDVVQKSSISESFYRLISKDFQELIL